jgi:hypothetical protein
LVLLLEDKHLYSRPARLQSSVSQRVEIQLAKRTSYQPLRVGKLKSAIVTEASNFGHFLGLQLTEVQQLERLYPIPSALLAAFFEMETLPSNIARGVMQVNMITTPFQGCSATHM